MRLVLSVAYSRHLFVNRGLLEHFDSVLVIIMQREDMLPKAPSYCSRHDKELLKSILIIVIRLKKKFMVNYLSKQCLNL